MTDEKGMMLKKKGKTKREEWKREDKLEREEKQPDGMKVSPLLLI